MSLFVVPRTSGLVKHMLCSRNVGKVGSGSRDERIANSAAERCGSRDPGNNPRHEVNPHTGDDHRMQPGGSHEDARFNCERICRRTSTREEVTGALPASMTIFYWLIPLFVVTVAIAVVPVLYGTLKHEDWEKREAALKEHQRAQLINIDSDGPPRVPEHHVHVALQDAHAETVALLRRIEHLTDLVEGETGSEAAAIAARPMATAGRRG